MVSVDSDMNVPAAPKDEFRLVFENLAGVLEAVGSSLDHDCRLDELLRGRLRGGLPTLRRGAPDGSAWLQAVRAAHSITLRNGACLVTKAAT
jgi:hypothetical protein